MGLTGNANVTASICGAGVVLCAGHGMSSWANYVRAFLKDRQGLLSARSVIFLIGLMINATALGLTASRVAFLATFCSIVLLSLATNRASKIRRRDRFAVTAALFLLAAAGASFMPDLLSQRAAVFETDAQMRWQVYERFWEMAKAAPWTGLGPGAFPQANVYFMRDVSLHMREMWIFNSPHSILLQLMFVGGFPYAALMTAAAALIARSILIGSGLRHAGYRDIGLILSIGVIFAVGMIDIPLDVPASADLVFLLVGLAWARRRSDRPRLTTSR